MANHNITIDTNLDELDQLLMLQAAETVEHSDVLSARRAHLHRLEQVADRIEYCTNMYHGEPCQRRAGHSGSCAAILIF
jgi:aminopeptidase-like protein